MDAQEQGTWVPEWTLGDRLRKAREVAGLEQGELAGRMGVARGTVHNYESDATTKVKRPYLREWAYVTGVSLHWLETIPGYMGIGSTDLIEQGRVSAF